MSTTEHSAGPGAPLVLTEHDGRVAVITLNRPRYRNAQNVRLLHALDDALTAAVQDDEVGCIVLRAAGEHWSAGHDIGSPGRDIDQPFGRRATGWYGHTGKPESEATFVREQEAYLGLCRRWRELPKPTIAAVHGACIAGGLMLAWVCDLIIASDDAFFADPVVRMGIPGVEYFAHAHVMSPRKAKEFLFLGGRMSAEEALAAGMINRVVPRVELDEAALGWARRIAGMPRLGLALTKLVINQAEDRQGLRDTMDSVFGYHHFAHAHNALSRGDYVGGQDVRSMKAGLAEPGGDDGEEG